MAKPRTHPIATFCIAVLVMLCHPTALACDEEFLLIIEDAPVAELAEDFSKFLDTRIVVLDEVDRTKRIEGEFLVASFEDALGKTLATVDLIWEKHGEAIHIRNKVGPPSN